MHSDSKKSFLPLEVETKNLASPDEAVIILYTLCRSCIKGNSSKGDSGTWKYGGMPYHGKNGKYEIIYQNLYHGTYPVGSTSVGIPRYTKIH